MERFQAKREEGGRGREATQSHKIEQWVSMMLANSLLRRIDCRRVSFVFSEFSVGRPFFLVCDQSGRRVGLKVPLGKRQ